MDVWQYYAHQFSSLLDISHFTTEFLGPSWSLFLCRFSLSSCVSFRRLKVMIKLLQSTLVTTLWLNINMKLTVKMSFWCVCVCDCVRGSTVTTGQSMPLCRYPHAVGTRTEERKQGHGSLHYLFICLFVCLFFFKMRSQKQTNKCPQ